MNSLHSLIVPIRPKTIPRNSLLERIRYISPQFRIFLEKLAVTQILEKFSAFVVIKRSLTCLQKHGALMIHFSSVSLPYALSLTSTFTSCSHIPHRYHRRPRPFRSTDKNFGMHFLSHDTCPADFISFYLIIRTIMCKEIEL